MFPPLLNPPRLYLAYNEHPQSLAFCTHVNVITRMQHVACVCHELFQVYRVRHFTYKDNFDMLLFHKLFNARDKLNAKNNMDIKVDLVFVDEG